MRLLGIFLFAIGINFQCLSQVDLSSEPAGFYTIVGAFAIKTNATKFNLSLIKKGIKSMYGFLPSQNIYYVYTVTNSDVSVCLREMNELRAKPEFSDAWVRFIGEKKAAIEKEEEKIAGEPKIISVEEEATVSKTEPVLEDSIAEESEKIIQPLNVTLGNTEIFLSLFNATNNKVAEGVVQVIDTDRGKLIEEVKGNTYLILPNPRNTSGNITLIADVLGYRKVQKEINFNNPLADSTFITQMGTSIIANFEMIKYHAGDIRTLYNIYFYNDAAIMMPESKYELNSLLAMMKENPTYQIRLHGHTNGNYHGKIVSMGPSGDFFSVTKDATTSVGSAKQLSEKRAGIIRDYLVANGIENSRVEVKAWGGKRPLFDKNSANAKKNIRVEVEIVKE